MKRRAFLASAAALAASTTSACALPARLLEDDAPLLEWIPCDGRELPVARYLDLFEALGSHMGNYNSQTFFLPRMGPWERDGVPLSPFLRVHGEQAGTIRYLEDANG